MIAQRNCTEKYRPYFSWNPPLPWRFIKQILYVKKAFYHLLRKILS